MGRSSQRPAGRLRLHPRSSLPARLWWPFWMQVQGSPQLDLPEAEGYLQSAVLGVEAFLAVLVIGGYMGLKSRLPLVRSYGKKIASVGWLSLAFVGMVL